MHSEIRSICIKLPSVFKAFDLSIFEWPLMTGFTVAALYAELKVMIPAQKVQRRMCFCT